MAQKNMPTTLKKQGRRNVIYRDADGKTYSAIVLVRDSATQADLMVRMGGMKRQINNVPLATTHAKQTNVYYFRTGH